jgi:hypothetical protein
LSLEILQQFRDGEAVFLPNDSTMSVDIDAADVPCADQQIAMICDSHVAMTVSTEIAQGACPLK